MSLFSSITSALPGLGPLFSGDAGNSSALEDLLPFADLSSGDAGSGDPIGGALGFAGFGGLGGAGGAGGTGGLGGLGGLGDTGGFAGLFGAPSTPDAPSAGASGLGGGLGGPTDPYVYGPTLSGAADDSRMHPVDQGSTSACGTSSLAMIMDYLGKPVSREDIDREVRRVDQGAMPGPLIDYARSQGLNAEGYNHGSWDEIKGFIDRGIPVQTLINTKADGNPSNGHFVAVVGFRTDPKTGQEQIGYRNSADGGKINWENRAEFENKWSNHFAGFDKFFTAYAPAGTDLPPGRWDGIEALSAMGNGAWNVMNNFDRIIHPENVGTFVHGLIGLPGGVVQGIGGAIGFGIQSAGQWLDQKVGDVPVLGLFARPLGQVIGGIGAGVGNLFGGIGDGINKVGGAFGQLFNGNVGGFFSGLWDAGGKVMGGVFGAAGSILGGVGSAVGSVAGTVVDGAKAVGKAVGGAVSAVGDFIGGLF